MLTLALRALRGGMSWALWAASVLWAALMLYYRLFYLEAEDRHMPNPSSHGCQLIQRSRFFSSKWRARCRCGQVAPSSGRDLQVRLHPDRPTSRQDQPLNSRTTCVGSSVQLTGLL